MKSIPKIDVELVLGTSYTDLIGDGIDVALRVGSTHQQSITARRLCELSRWVVVSPKYLEEMPLKDPSELVEHRCLTFPYENNASTWYFTAADNSHQAINIQSRIAVADGLALKQLALDGLGPALLPSWLCAQEVSEQRLVRLFSEYKTTTSTQSAAIWMIYARRSFLPLKVKVFTEYVKGLFVSGASWERDPKQSSSIV